MYTFGVYVFVYLLDFLYAFGVCVFVRVVAVCLFILFVFFFGVYMC